MSANVSKSHPARRKPDLTCSLTVRLSRMFTPGIVAPFVKKQRQIHQQIEVVGETSGYTLPMKEDVKRKRFSPPLRKMRVW